MIGASSQPAWHRLICYITIWRDAQAGMPSNHGHSAIEGKGFRELFIHKIRSMGTTIMVSGFNVRQQCKFLEKNISSKHMTLELSSAN